MKFKLLFATLLLAACGGVEDGYYEEETELGQLSEPMITQIKNPNGVNQYVTGVMYEENPLNGLTFAWTTSGSDSQTVFVPFNKALTFKTAQGQCSASQLTAMRQTLDNLIIQLTSVYGGHGWSFARNEASGLHTVQCLNLNWSPLGWDNIRSYSRTQCNIDFSRPITSIDSRVPGNLVHFTNCFVHIDVPDIYAKGASSSQDAQLLWHAVAHGVMKIMGIGAHADNSMNVMANEYVFPMDGSRTLVTTGASCRTKHYAPGTGGQWALYNLSNSANCDNN